MSWKLSLPLPALIFLGALLAVPAILQAQSIVLITLAVISVGEGEAGEILWVDSTPGSQERRIFQAWLTLQNGGPSASSCQQTVQVPVTPTPGLNSLTIYKDGTQLFVNDAMVLDSLDPCFDGPTRIVFHVRVPGSAAPQTTSGQDPVDPDGPRLGLPNLKYQAVIDRATGATRAAGLLPGTGYQYGETEILE